MSTNDVPGAKASNNDELAMGCWAEHADGSLILVESTEGGRVIYSIFDMDKIPITEYRDAMADGAFKKNYSFNPKKPTADKWTWHDKTAFPWDRIIKAGARDGTRFASVEDQLNAAERIRRSREIHQGRAVEPAEVESRIDRLGEKANRIIKRLQKAISDLGAGE